jgi:hypothetical protein
VAVEKLGFSQKSQKSGDRKCLGDLGKSFIELLTRSSFCEIEVSEFFNSHRDYHQLSQSANAITHCKRTDTIPT